MQGWDHPVSLKQVHWTPWVLFPPWFPALVPIVCLFLSWLSSSPLWETEANSGSIVPHFYFLCVLCCWRTFALLPQALWDQTQFSFGSTKISSVPLFLHIGRLSNLSTDLFSFLRLSLQSSLEWKSVFSHFTLFGIWISGPIFDMLVLTVFPSPACSGLSVKARPTELLEDVGCSCSRWWCVFQLCWVPRLLWWGCKLQDEGSWAIAGERGNFCRCLLEESALCVIPTCSQMHTHYPSQSFALKWRQKPWQSIFSAIGALCLDMTESDNWAGNTRFT